MPPLAVRTARTEDLPALVALLAELFALEPDFAIDPARQRRGLELLLEDRLRRTVLVAEAGGMILGMVTGQLVVSTAEGAASVWVKDWGKARGANRLSLLADRENAAALAFHAARGWAGTRMVCLRRRAP
ncbi:MAG: GNAT family N-acetyltransferase [Anaeromyxobacteraceae bacterium]